MARSRTDFVSGVLASALLNDSTDTTLNSDGLASLPVIAAPTTATIVLDPDGDNGDPEIVHVSVHAAAGVTATIVRGREDSAIRAHAINTKWRHVPTAADWADVAYKAEANTFTATNTFTGSTVVEGLEVNGALDHDGTTVGFYGVAPTTRPAATDDIKTALALIGLLTDGGASPLNLDGGALTSGAASVTTLAASGASTLTGKVTTGGELEVDGDLNHDGTNVGFFGVAPTTRPASTADIKAALALLGLLTAGGATPLNLEGGALTSGTASVTTLAASGTSALTGKVTAGGEVEIDGDLNHDGTNVGFFGVAPAARPAALTQTYATASRTHAAPTAVAVETTAATNVTPYGYSEAQANAIVTAINALVVDLANTKQVLNSLIDDLQSLGLEQ